MKNLVKKSMVPAFATALCVLAAGQAQAVSVNIFQITDPHSLAANAGIIGWLNAQGMANDPFNNVTILEDFEGQDPGWYTDLSTDVGTFVATGDPGTGSTSYNANHNPGSSDPYFEVRDYDANGRYNVYPFHTGTNYLDSADITQLTLELYLDESGKGLKNLFFTVTDPGDIGAITTTTGIALTSEIDSRELGTIDSGSSDGSLWFVGVAVDEDEGYLAQIIWDVKKNNGTGFTDDGFGLDSLGTVNVPEPATALLLGAGLIPLMGFLRRRKEEM